MGVVLFFFFKTAEYGENTVSNSERALAETQEKGKGENTKWQHVEDADDILYICWMHYNSHIKSDQKWVYPLFYFLQDSKTVWLLSN